MLRRNTLKTFTICPAAVDSELDILIIQIISKILIICFILHSILGTGPIFADRTGPAGLTFATGPDRPVTGRFNFLTRLGKNRQKTGRSKFMPWPGKNRWTHVLSKQLALSQINVLIQFYEDMQYQTYAILEAYNSNDFYMSLSRLIC